MFSLWGEGAGEAGRIRSFTRGPPKVRTTSQEREGKLCVSQWFPLISVAVIVVAAVVVVVLPQCSLRPF